MWSTQGYITYISLKKELASQLKGMVAIRKSSADRKDLLQGHALPRAPPYPATEQSKRFKDLAWHGTALMGD